MEKRLMKKTITIIVLMIFFITSSTSAVQVSITQTQTSHIPYNTPDTIEVIPTENALYCRLQINEEDLHFDTFQGYDIIEINDYDVSAEPGKPILPVKTLRIALPPDRKATQIHLRYITTQPLTGLYTLLPAQPPEKTNSISNDVSLLPLATDVSFSLHPYPSEPVQITGHCDLAGQAMVDLAFYPLIYLASQHQVTLITSISFTVELTEGYTCGDYLSKSISDQGKEMYKQMVQRMVINPRQVTLRSAPHPLSKGVPPGNYEYVIITQESFVSAFEPLRDWKTKKGTPATIVTTSWIYNNGGYSGTNVEKIKAFVQDAQTTWGTMYFLLGGDTNAVPYSSRTFSNVDPDPVPNDTYYADYDNDWVCEVHVGRASVTAAGSGVGQIGNFINKTLTYEKNPPLTNYATCAGFYGFNLDSSTPAEQCKITITNSYIPTSWTLTAVYDSHTGNHKTNVIAAINAGQNLMNHADHSNYDYMGTGYVNHDLGLENADMDALTNGNKQGIFYSMGCWPAAYDFSNSIAEHFVRDNNGGGIAFVGNSRYGWYNPGYVNTLSMKYDIYFFKSLFPENNYKLGACFSDHKNDAYQYDFYGHYKYIFTELTLLGDPELPIWKENPMNLTASHPSQIPLNTSSFIVTVTSNGSPVNQAYVCLWKGTEIYERGLTNTAGTITLSITPNSTGTLYVTITKQNYLPFESTAQVLETNQAPYTPHTPSPPDLATAVSITEDLSWQGGDPDAGDTVTYDVYFGTTSPPPKITSNQSTSLYDPGTMNYQTAYYWRIIAWDNHGTSTTGPTWQFTTATNLPPEFGTPTPANGSTNQPLSFTWSIPINDPEGDPFSWAISCSNGESSSGAGSLNGTKPLPLSGLAYSTTYTIWVNATDPAGSGLYTRRWYTFTTGLAGANYPPLFGMPSPANGSLNQSLSFLWNIPIYDPDGDEFSWTIQCNNGQTNSGTGAANGTKTLALSDMTYSTTYTVWVNATDPSGSGEYTSSWYTFTTQQQENNPPDKPETPTGETNGNINIIYTYTTSTTDLDGDQVYYLWDWGDGTQSTWLGPYTSGATISTTHTWAKKGSYSIKVKAKDTFDAESDWSDPLPVTMPYSYQHPIRQLLMALFERFPTAFPLLRLLCGY
ncbi:MAG: C25 family cysteine peptidase [Candidatus Thermoplasmatota archaeon]